MNHDLALIAWVLESRDLKAALSLGANADLLNDEAAVYWETIVGHYDRFHEVPSIAYFQGLSPGYEHNTPSDSLEALVHELKTMKLGGEIESLIKNLGSSNVTDPWEAKRLLVTGADSINVHNQAGSTEYIVGADKVRVKNLLKMMREGGGLLGYPWPWEYMNLNSQGVTEGLYYLYGREKSKKTFLLLYLALYFSLHLGRRVLFFTREMTEKKLKMRIYPMACGFDIKKWQTGDLTTDGEQHLEDVMDTLSESGNFIICDQAGEGFTGFKAKIEEYKPDIVIHDCPKKMADDAMGDKSTAKENVYVARMIDQVSDYAAGYVKIPFFLAGHANREGAKSDGTSSIEHAWSDHIVRKVDMAMRVINDNNTKRLGLVVNTGRDVESYIGFTINGQLYQGFGEQVGDNCAWVKDFEKNKQAEESSSKRADPAPQSDGVSRFSPRDWKEAKRPHRFRQVQ